MNREDVVRASRELNFNTLSNYGAQLFVWQYCVHKGKDPQQSKRNPYRLILWGT